MTIQSPTPQNSEIQAEIILPFSAIDLSSLPSVGGKAANLGEMLQVGLPVPPGFCVTTTAYALVAEASQIEELLTELATTDAKDTASLTQLVDTIRARLLEAPIPSSIAEAITEAYHTLGAGESVPVAVRSSATAEDLPFASFAGQQETYLNIIGEDALIDAVRRCWASLWTDRAISYRASNGIDQHSVRLAVAVQRMVDATVAGILFTANPLTGKRRQAVIDASPGLGEAVVSGEVNPDHFVINSVTGEFVERRIGDKHVAIQARAGGGTQRIEQATLSNESCLTDERVRAVAELGAKIEAHYGAPQDIEWAIDSSGYLWLTQSRPITTLFPLPASAPATDDVLRVYFSANVFQGMYRPFTPMGVSSFRLIGSALAIALALPPREIFTGPGALVEAASRLFIDVTVPIRSSFGRKLLLGMAKLGETLSAGLFEQLLSDPRLSLVPARRWKVARTFGKFMLLTRAPLYFPQAMFWPSAAVSRVEHIVVHMQEIKANFEKVGPVGSIDRLAALEQVYLDWMPRTFPSMIPVFVSGLVAHNLAGRLLQGLASPDELQTVLRGLPHNPTTEMDIALWKHTHILQDDKATTSYLQETPLEQQVNDYRKNVMPVLLYKQLSTFLSLYGHRGVAEIDLGVPRWSEDPTYILSVIANYLKLQDPDMAPDVQFRRGAQAAEAMVTELTRRASRKGRVRGLLVGFLLKRTRALVGIRELPKFSIIYILASIREQLWYFGEKLELAERLETAGDIFFITFPEVHAAMTGTDMRDRVRERRITYEQELKRRHVPRILLSDGTEPGTPKAIAQTKEGVLTGTPASAGIVTGIAHVVYDPANAHLEPGKILVTPSTDPGWTPLFLTAGGLVMEMGGSISHGAVVAREYGIPAVVGVLDATKRIISGQRITVDGSNGIVSIEK
ncbi:MAG TPA: PEP/pyruvate-binding domain-containing protein [Ktedonobacteraceae bacterium]|nr:PEP/pyruvate-binding domain-containing protein [Ktedonobacteraceae bacterium]